MATLPTKTMQVIRPGRTSWRCVHPCIIALLWGHAVPAGAEPEPTVKAAQQHGDPDWQGITSLELVQVGPADPDSATIRFAWNQEALLAQIEVTDSNLVVDPDQPIWRNDAVEILIDPSFDRVAPAQSDDIQYLIRADGGATARNVGDGAGGVTAVAVGQMSSTVTALTTGYLVHARLPWAELGIDPDLQRELGFLVGIDDRDPSGVTSYSHHNVQSFLMPDIWGRLDLSAQPTIDPDVHAGCAAAPAQAQWMFATLSALAIMIARRRTRDG